MGPLGTSKFQNCHFNEIGQFCFLSSQGNIFELKNVTGNLIAPIFNRWCLFNENPISQEDHSRSKFSRLLLNILVQVLLGPKIITHGSTHAMVFFSDQFRSVTFYIQEMGLIVYVYQV